MVNLVTETTPDFQASISKHRFFIFNPPDATISDKKNTEIMRQVMVSKGFSITESPIDSIWVWFFSSSRIYLPSSGTFYMGISIHMSRAGGQGVQGSEAVWRGSINLNADDFDKNPAFFISNVLDKFGQEDIKVNEEWFPSSGNGSPSTEKQVRYDESRQESAIVTEMKLEDISVTVSSNTLKLRNFKVLVGPILSTPDGGKSDLLSPEIIAVESGFMKAGFTIVDRKFTKNILSEMYLQQTGIVSARDAARLGEISGAGIIVTGDIDMFGLVDKVPDAEVQISVSLKAISIESSEILAVAHYYGGLKKGFLRVIAQRLGNELLKFGGPVMRPGD